MVISPIKAEALAPVITDALKQASLTSDKLKPYSKLSDDQNHETQQLCYFLAFGICEVMNDRVAPEIETMIRTIAEIREIPEAQMSEAIIGRIELALLNLRQLKGGGLIPGERITIHDASKYIYKGAKTFCKRAPSAVFEITEWDVDFESIRIANDTIQGKFPLSELIFIIEA